MNKREPKRPAPRMKSTYDFSKGTRGRYARRYAAGTNVVVLEPDLAKVFRSSEEVNRALRSLVELARRELANGGK